MDTDQKYTSIHHVLINMIDAFPAIVRTLPTQDIWPPPPSRSHGASQYLEATPIDPNDPPIWVLKFFYDKKSKVHVKASKAHILKQVHFFADALSRV